ncbi:leucyl-tRNA synthetase [Dictyostelium purpureum]|uniref:leucine--tRNA ligase n=1 Tax=Dictyostelium purpureum TaxID=5786 RepID=F0ZU55_DICPU|nr:leucyl-tRNA synthetase [Dictyostelium purpureum]EGC32540.1 leucyl-tRNA synthetase [Dictyostelium purpureum]|eukprot:XP_003290952.1 leucyl-tRNA synthetase [Dictyostelium purpureum]
MSTAKLDFIREYEKEYQKVWEDNKSFEIDALDQADPEHPKYLATFPYPYMNGRLHLGHAFTITKAEYMCQYQRLKGRRVLFPFGFHCTGMPIKACADKLTKEIQLYGNPPVFPVEEKKEEVKEPVVAVKEDPLQFKSKKTKAVAKSGGAVYQWKIMQSLGIPDEEIPKFADSAYWLNYFPPHCEADLKLVGAGIDWRRSFITTDVNGYYDTFVRWQFENLKALGKVKYGKRYSIWSTIDDQQCADHERSQGEGVGPQNYTLIKLQVKEPVPECLKPIHEQGKKIFLAPGTLRPETMYGQTNCWILPTGQYGAFEMGNGDVFVCTERSARNMAYQNLTTGKGEYKCLAKFTGQDILGAALKAPLAINETVYVLPMLSVDEEKGTGVVTSVPSDSPDDYASLQDLKNKAPFRAKFGIKDEWVLPFEVIPIIDIPGYSTTSAIKACQENNVKSQNDRALLDKAKETCYQKGFNDGIMMVGKYAGRKVSEVKKIIKDEMIAAGEAVEYSEPASKVVSRSGDECVVALTDQWYINYGDDDIEWKNQTIKQLENMEFYNPETKKKFEHALGWMNQWACSRSFGLGTRLPWDEQFLIESLSDSTIYMAFYTVAHLLQADINGSKPGTANITPSQMTSAVWDHVLLGKDYPEGCAISKDTLALLRKEFTYWYPVDIRVSGADLIQNHLTFFLYTHAAMFEQKFQPKSIRANGFVLLNGNKMSKSTGNFLTLADAITKFSADGTRIALADAGDGIDDANFVEQTGVTALLKLHTQIQWIQETLDSIDKFRSGPLDRVQDTIFDSEMNNIIVESDKAYQRSNFRDALHLVFFDLQNARDHYKVTTLDQMHKDLVLKFIEIQAVLIYPIAPHFAQKIFNILGKGSILDARWPTAGPIDFEALKKNSYIESTIYSFRTRLQLFQKAKGKGKTASDKILPEKSTILFSKSYPKWQQDVLEYLASIYDENTKSFTKDNNAISEELRKREEFKPHLKNLMGFVAAVGQNIKEIGKDALQTSLTFDESEILKENIDYICKTLEITTFDVQEFADTTQPAAGKGVQAPQPGRPTFSFI